MQAFCRLHGIRFGAYSSLGGQWLGQWGGRNPVLLNPIILEIAGAHRRSAAQVVLRWALQHNQVCGREGGGWGQRRRQRR